MSKDFSGHVPTDDDPKRDRCAEQVGQALTAVRDVPVFTPKPKSHDCRICWRNGGLGHTLAWLAERARIEAAREAGRGEVLGGALPRGRDVAGRVEV